MRVVDMIFGVAAFVAGVMILQTPTKPPKDEWFQSVVVNDPRPVLVKFGADWCPPCRHMEKVLDDLAPRVGDRVKIVRINIDEKQNLASHYRVSSIPRVFLFKNGQIAASHGGFADAQDVQKWIEQN